MKAKQGSKAKAKPKDFFCEASFFIDIFCKAGQYLLQSGAISVPNLTFEREEEVKGVTFGGQTFAGPTQQHFPNGIAHTYVDIYLNVIEST